MTRAAPLPSAPSPVQAAAPTQAPQRTPAAADSALPALHDWLDRQAESLDSGDGHALEVLPRLAGAGRLRRAVPERLGGDGAALSGAIEAIADVAEHSLAAAFAFWGQRVFIEFLVQGDNPALLDRYLPSLLDGTFAGASSLSNAMKHLSGIESVGLVATGPQGAGSVRINGTVPWITNVRRTGFIAAAAVAIGEGGLAVVALPHDRPGLTRSEDLDLIALRGTQTAALKVEALVFDDDDVIAAQARRWLPRVRPAFLGLQCGLSIGLARASLAAARRLGVNAKAVLGPGIDQLEDDLQRLQGDLGTGVDDGRFVESPVALFETRIGLARVVNDAARLELLASGGRAYHRDGGHGFARRWREAAFIPIVTPSLTQLEGELLRHRSRA